MKGIAMVPMGRFERMASANRALQGNAVKVSREELARARSCLAAIANVRGMRVARSWVVLR
jgi:hypothetical protein